MIQLLRFIGIANAGVWFGTALFVTFFAGPAFFSDRMVTALQYKYFAGLAAQIILSRYFLLQYLCSFIALAHLLVEWFYLGRRQSRFTVGLWIGLSALILIGGLRLQPRLHELHQTKYSAVSAAAQTEADQSFRVLHGVSQAANLVVLTGLLIYFWRTIFPAPDPARFSGYRDFRG